MSRSIISLEHVGLTYRKRMSFFRHGYYQALRSVSFDIFEGETLGLLGRNGCGKSTLLRLIAGIFSPDTGSVQRHGAQVSLLSLSIGFDPELTGRENIILNAMLLGATKSEACTNMPEIIEFSELDGFIDEPVKTYSSGMQLRLGFSIAVTIKPDVLLIDEVLGVGDAHFREKAEAVMNDKIASSQTVVLVSHNSEQLARLCSRVLWLEEGTIKMQGDPITTLDCYEAFIAKGGGVGRVQSRQVT